MVAIMQQQTQQTFAEMLRGEREARDWTQQQAADAIGVTMKTYWRWESGLAWPGATTRVMLCRIFEFPLLELRKLCIRERVAKCRQV